MYFAGDEEKDAEHAYVISYKELVFMFALLAKSFWITKGITRLTFSV